MPLHPGHYDGPAQMFDETGVKIADVRLIAHANDGDSGVLPEWDGERLVGRAAWKGTAIAPEVDWKALVARREPVTVVVGTHSAVAVITYEVDDEGRIEGGQPVPW